MELLGASWSAGGGGAAVWGQAVQSAHLRPLQRAVELHPGAPRRVGELQPRLPARGADQEGGHSCHPGHHLHPGQWTHIPRPGALPMGAAGVGGGVYRGSGDGKAGLAGISLDTFHQICCVMYPTCLGLMRGKERSANWWQCFQ